MTLSAAFVLFAVMLVLAAVPSSSVALVVARSAGAGLNHGFAAAAGIVLGDLVFVALALLGMSALAEILGGFFTGLKLAAGACLIWLGVALFRAGPASLTAPASRSRGWLLADALAGLLLTLGDIKAILFYASLFPLVLDVGRLTPADMLLIGGITVVAVGGVKVTYALLGRRLSGRLPTRAPKRLAGLLLIGCGGTLLVKA